MNGELPRVSAADVERYQRDGVACLRGVFDSDWIALLAEGFERTLAQPSEWFSDHAPEEGAGRFVTDLAMGHHDPDFRRFAFDSPAAEIAARLMGAEHVNFFFDTMWIKGAGVSKTTNWHQDQPYYTVDGDQMCVVWVALDPMPADVALECVRGSHRWGRWFEPIRTTEGTSWYAESDYDPVPDIDASRADYELVSWDVQPGDCVVFHGLTLHGAQGNPLAYDRRAYASVWLGEDTRWANRPGSSRPRFTGHGLEPGDPIDSPLFPRVWPRA